MATTTNKQRQLTHFFTALRKACPAPDPVPLPVLEQFVHALCREGASREQADQAYKALRGQFFDWNEVRVSSPRELEEVMGDLPGAAAKAERIVSFLQEVFETTFSFDLEPLHKKGVKQAAKSLARFQAANDYVVATVVQGSLGGHAIPLDAPSLRCSRRLGLVEVDGEDVEAQRTSLEHLVPKAKGPHFSEMLSFAAVEYCWEEEPNCSACPLAADCPSAEVVAVARTGRGKPR